MNTSYPGLEDTSPTFIHILPAVQMGISAKYRTV